MEFVRQAGQQDQRAAIAAGPVVVARAQLVAQVEGEEMLFGDRAVALALPAQAQFDQPSL
ncbi:MAG: hypothetical protein MUE63_15525 [Xanthomonadales bacterium]|nr:hypothetical protein [Xanthomonadales bacterium]